MSAYECVRCRKDLDDCKCELTVPTLKGGRVEPRPQQADQRPNRKARRQAAKLARRRNRS